MSDNLPALFLPTCIDPQLRASLSALNERMRVLFGPERVTVSDLKDPNYLLSLTDTSDDPDSPDSDPPGMAHTITTEKHENFIRLRWVNPADKDLYYVDIYRKTAAGDTPVKIATVTAPTAHYDDLDTNPVQSYWYYLNAYDDAGNSSGLAPIVDNDNVVLASELPAPDAVTLAGWDQDDLHLSCDPVEDFGVSGYLWMIVDNGSEVRSEITTDSTYIYSFAKNAEDGLRYEVEVRVWTMDIGGNPSPDYAAATVTHTPPAIPTNVVVETRDLGFILFWDMASDSSVVGYHVGLNDVVLETVSDIRYLHKTLLTAGTYQFQVRSVNRFGQTSSWNTQVYVVFGPNAPVNFRSDVISNTIVLYWDEPALTELPIIEYEIRKGPWDSPSAIYRKKGTFTTLTEAQAGTYQYHLAAVDSAGNIGEHATHTVSCDDPPGYELNVEWQDDFLGGTATNVLVMPDGTAYAPCYPDRTIRQQFVGTGSDVAPQFPTVQAMIDAGYTYPVGPVPTTAEFAEEHDYGAVLTSSTITSTLSTVSLLGSPTSTTFLASKETSGDAYVEEEGTRVTRNNFQFVRDRFTFASDGYAFVKLQMHTLRLDSKPVSESGRGTITDANAGITFTFTKVFADIKHIAPTYYGDGTKQLTPVVDFDDVPYPTTCTIYLVGSSGKDVGEVGYRAEGWI